MNYRHAFHAGNFADILKHVIVLDLMRRLTATAGPLTVVDTHAGAGGYDLAGDLARKTGEGQAGIVRLMAEAAAPAVFDPLKAAVRAMNAGQGAAARYYPGSPLLIAPALRPGDRYLACEIRPDDATALQAALKGVAGAQVRQADGWAVAAAEARAAGRSRRLLVLIDPPFERGDDYRSLVDTSAVVLAAAPGACIAIWVPIKDLATFDALLGDLEDVTDGASLLVSEVRLRPLTDPMKMNGCAMLVLGGPPGALATARITADWIATSLGEAGARGLTRLI